MDLYYESLPPYDRLSSRWNDKASRVDILAYLNEIWTTERDMILLRNMDFNIILSWP